MDSILVVDDNHEFRSIVCDFLLDAGYDVWDVACPDEAFTLLKREKIDLLVCDLHMPFTLGEDFAEFAYSSEVGLKTLSEIAWVFPGMPLIAISAMAEPESLKVRNEIGAVPLLQKPFHHTELLGLVKDLLSVRQSAAVH